MPRPITCLPFSLSLETMEESESPETMTNVSDVHLAQGQIHRINDQPDIG